MRAVPHTASGVYKAQQNRAAAAAAAAEAKQKQEAAKRQRQAKQRCDNSSSSSSSNIKSKSIITIMVFFSTLQALLGLPLSRSVFAFGSRQISARIVAEEVAMGLLLVMPASTAVAFLAVRLAASGAFKPPFLRHDLWTTFVVTVVGDLFLEVLLPSLQCLPAEHPFSFSP